MSERIKVLSPIVEQYALTVSIPLEMSIIIMKGQSIYEAEEYFIRKRDCVNSHGRKVELDRARAMIKYAYTCNATLIDLTNVEHQLKITLGFSDITDLIGFRDTMDSAVSSSTMK